jgi:hypothetical protein
MLLHEQWVIEEIREENKSFPEFNQNKAHPIRNYGTQQRQS